MTLPPFPAHLVAPALYAASSKLDCAARDMHVACHLATAGDTAKSGCYREYAIGYLGEAAAALGYTLTPIPAPVQAPATAEALFDGVPV
jgi:hypothetical protein